MYVYDCLINLQEWELTKALCEGHCVPRTNLLMPRNFAATGKQMG